MQETNYIILAWGVAAVVLLLGFIACGLVVNGYVLGVLVDTRNRFSLSRLQVVLWTIVLVSLLAGVAFGRLFDPGDADQILEFTIPPELWGVMGISVASTATATVIKSSKDNDDDASIGRATKPTLSNFVTVEEGEGAGELVDVGKYQNLWFTLLLIVAYIGQAGAAIRSTPSADQFDALPAFTSSFLVLLGISHAGYLSVKVPKRRGSAVRAATDQQAGFTELRSSPADGKTITFQRGGERD